jgi:hypothetical protein
VAVDPNAMKLLTFVMRHLKNESIPQPLTHQFRKPRIMAQDLGQATQVKFDEAAELWRARKIGDKYEFNCGSE